MDKKICDSFKSETIEAVTSVFDMMAGVEIQQKGIVSSDSNEVKGDVSGIIGLSSDHVKGSIAISFQEGLAKEVVANMLGMTANEISEEEIKDGIGEIANMVAGDINNKMGNLFKISLPSVILGKRHSVSLSHDGDAVIMTFMAFNDEFHIIGNFEEIKNSKEEE